MSSTHILRSSNHNLYQTQSQRASHMPAQSHTIPHMLGHCPNPNSTNFKSSFSLIMSLRSRSTVQRFNSICITASQLQFSNTTNCQNSNQTCKSMSVCLSNHNYEFVSKYHSFMPVRKLQLTITQLFLAQCEPDQSNSLHFVYFSYGSGHRLVGFCHLPIPK
jgi:hypothetical protein